jgi:hypothetical protein
MTHPADDPLDLERLAGYADDLADAIDFALPGWVERCVTDHLGHLAAGPARDLAEASGREAGRRARADVGPAVRDLLARDVDEQRLNPLSLLRDAVRYPTTVLKAAGAPVAPRDDFAERTFPDDVYDLSPASFADVDPALHEPGLMWGAAKAHVILRRRRYGGD